MNGITEMFATLITPTRAANFIRGQPLEFRKSEMCKRILSAVLATNK